MAETQAPVVVKVGGSLLDWPLLPRRLGEYLDRRAGDRLVVVVGGGAAGDWVRTLDEIHGLGDDKAHALALRALEFSAYALSALIPDLEVVDVSPSFDPCWRMGKIPLLSPRVFLDGDDRESPDPLPHSWAATTDAIAARLAVRLGARELVLLKSAPLPIGADRAEAARLGLVDRAFLAASETLPLVRYVHLRDEVIFREDDLP